jgi:hypothetical protein
VVDAGTLADLRVWKRLREQQGARSKNPVICLLKPTRRGPPVIRHTIRERYLLMAEDDDATSGPLFTSV